MRNLCNPTKRTQFRLLSLLVLLTMMSILFAWMTRPRRILERIQGDWEIVSSQTEPSNTGVFSNHVGEIVSISGDQFAGIALDHPRYPTSKRIVLPMNTFPQVIHLQETREPHFLTYSGNVRVREDELKLWINHSLPLAHQEHVVLRRVAVTAKK